MTERGLTFIDVDENRLELWLKQDRVQLVVVDSRPELEAGELRRFASVMFAEYVGRDLVARLAAARLRLAEVRDRIAGDELAGVLDGALRAIDDVARAATVPEPTLLPEPDLERPCEPAADPVVEPVVEPGGSAPVVLTFHSCRPYPPLEGSRKASPSPSPRGGGRRTGRTPGGGRAGEPSSLGWR